MIIPVTRTILFLGLIFAICSCRVKKGCPSNGANVGAEKILSGDPQAEKDIKKGKKYRLNKY